ncbi:MAG: PqqD family protein [Acetatifactor sp.]|nr:PqqD family protein [Acetatifactor sp.]
MYNIAFATHISWQILPDQHFGFVYNIKEKKYYALEDTELVVWNIISQHKEISLNSLIDTVATYYCINSEDIEHDISEFIDSLFEIGVITKNGRDKYKKSI